MPKTKAVLAGILHILVHAFHFLSPCLQPVLGVSVRNLRWFHVLWPPKLLKTWNNYHNFYINPFFFPFKSSLRSNVQSNASASQLSSLKPFFFFFFSRKCEKTNSEWGERFICDYKIPFVMKNRCYSIA